MPCVFLVYLVATVLTTALMLECPRCCSQVDNATLRHMVRMHESKLWGIFKGKIHSERHQLYRNRGKDRRDLKYTVGKVGSKSWW